ncbi:MAG: phosphoenolpyruvate--protein phosphotransferase [Rhodocyclaceae bacterium]|nr:phosphoenolpyruvate--protein phosphotransferase [Rhodocyclaceae bacterium]
MSFVIHGIGVSSGIAIGHAQLMAHAAFEVPHYDVSKSQIEAEVARFDRAMDETHTELQSLIENLPVNAPPEYAAFVQLHLMILNDPTLAEEPRVRIREQHCNAEWALKQQMDMLVAEFEAIEDAYLRERRADVEQVVERVLKGLMGRAGLQPRPGAGETILIAHDLAPSDVVHFKQQRFEAFLTDVGGVTSHTAILARSLNVPAVVSLRHARELIHDRDLLIVDGSLGAVIVNPDREVLAEYRLRASELQIERRKLARLRTSPAKTFDGTPIELHANIELPGDMEQVQASGATGIGLFRSEFLFLDRNGLPTEEEQFVAYRQVAEEIRGQPVIIRTLDLGADKQLTGLTHEGDNPALGLRAVRLCLAEPQLFRTQLRAILRAAQFGDVRLLIPMLSGVGEMRQVFAAIEDAKASLRRDGLPCRDDIPVGGMIEVPATAIMLRPFLDALDFVSVGTNDLIQYTLAIDRTDGAVSHLYDPTHPAILQLVASVIKAGARVGKPVALCGEMAGEVRLTRLLLGLGLREFSMHPANVPAVKQRVLQTDLREAETLARRILASTDPDKVQTLLERLNG